MGKTLKQFRFYGSTDSRKTLNSPTSITRNNLKTGSIFFNSAELISMASIGIQTIPGMKFRLNDSEDYIIVGSTGIYELDLSDNYEITSLKFLDESLDLIDYNESAYLIIDVVYNTEG